MTEEITNAISSATDELWGIWFLIGASLVFFMQCGFAMVETGFTRAKNAGNIIMKNLMDFCIGTVVFVLLGSSLMLAEDYVMGLFGVPNLDIFTNYDTFDWSGFVFNLVFCATAATIVSGAMAERTKFISYCIYSGVISLVIYPIEAGWVWNSKGWLAQLGYIDFAGSSVIHMVGGISALIGAAMLGPRIGKYVKDKKTGKKVSRAIPGHSIPLGALGVFILWFGWYGFNGAAATRLDGVGGLASIFLTTTISPAVATCVTMIFTWIRYGKPDVSMSLNGSLAGLVAVTAGCATVDALGSAIIGAVAGILVVVAIEGIDKVLHVDDPVGAVAVHCVNGIWGTLACGLFSTENGLFYGGGWSQLGKQCLGILAIGCWTAVTISITFYIIKKTVGLRASREEELAGLDSSEHGLESAYADFVVLDSISSEDTPTPEVVPEVPEVAPVPVEHKMAAPEAAMVSAASGVKMTKISMIVKPTKVDELKSALSALGITGMTITQVQGFGMQMGSDNYYRGAKVDSTLRPKVKVELVVSKIPVESVVETAKKVLYTGHYGDGKIFVYDVENVIKIRTGEEGYDALQDVE